MKKAAVIFFLGFFVAAVDAAVVRRPVHTYSIVAIDTATGQMGVAVQSHWFSVGSSVCWAEAGVGVVATQSIIEPGYGAMGLDLMRRGKSAGDALRALLAVDPTPEVRQVAMLDVSGRVSAHTGNLCIPEAGHVTGPGFSCQANLMERNTVWKAMATAYEKTRGELVDRLMNALEAAEAEKGDIRGKQSAAILVVRIQSSGQSWNDKLFDLRVEDHPQPLPELKRLIGLAKAYNCMNRGDNYFAQNQIQMAMKEYTAAMEMVPGNAEMIFWPAVTLAMLGRVEESLPLFKKVFLSGANWVELVRRLPAANQLPKDPAVLEKILTQAPAPGKKKK